MIDLHTHAISGDRAAYPVRPLGGARSSWSKERPVTAEELVRSLDEAGVAKAALVQPATVYGFDNSYAADTLKRYPGRFAGVASVDFLAPDAVETARYWIRDRGFSGVRLHPDEAATGGAAQGAGLDDPAADRLWAYLQDRRVPVCVALRGPLAARLAAVLRRFPALVVALDHAGGLQWDGPSYDSPELFALAGFEHVFVKVTSSALTRVAREPGGSPARFVRKLVDGFGARRVAWGSNFPASAGPLRALRELAEESFALLSPEERREAGDESAKRIYPALSS